MDRGVGSWMEYRFCSFESPFTTPSLSILIYKMRVDLRNAFFFGEMGGVKVWINPPSGWIG